MSRTIYEDVIRRISNCVLFVLGLLCKISLKVGDDMSLRFKCFYEQSKIFDFLEFPKIVFFKEETIEKEKQESNYVDLVPQEDIEFMMEVSNKLKPFKKEIEEFYGEEISFINEIRVLHGFLSYNSIDEYLNSLLELNDYEIKYKLLYGLMVDEESKECGKEFVEKAKKMAENQNEILSYIKNLSMDSSLKWNFFCIFNEPRVYIKKYVDLMNSLLDYFNEIYNSFSEEIKEAGNDFVNEVEKYGLNYISNEFLREEVLPDDIPNNEMKTIISFIEPYSIGLRVGGCSPYLIWGFRVKNAMEKIRKVNENKLNERIVAFKNLGDKTRYEVLKLVAKGVVSTKIIAEKLGVSSATISYHLSNLSTSRLIKINKENSTYGYEVNYEYIEWVISEFKNDIKGNILA